MPISTGIEGDVTNANYWYRQAGRPSQSGAGDAEWHAMAAEMLKRLV